MGEEDSGKGREREGEGVSKREGGGRSKTFVEKAIFLDVNCKK